MAGLGEASFEIQVRLDALRSDMKRARKIVGRGAREMGDTFQKAGKSIANFGTKLTALTAGAIAGVVTGLGAMTRKAGKYADALLDARDATGLSLQELQRWQVVATEAGVASDVAEQGVKELNNIAFRSERGLKRANYALGQIGVSMEEIKGASAKEKLDLVNQGLRGIEDSSRRAQLAQILYAGAQKDMMPIVNMSSDAVDKLKKKHKELGIELSEGQVKALNDTRAKTDQLRKTFGALANKIIVELAPYISDLFTFLETKAIPIALKMVEKFKQFIEKVKGMNKETIKQRAQMGALIALIPPLIALFGKVIQVVGFLMQNFHKLKTALKVTRVAAMGIIGIFVLVVIAIVKLWKENEDFRKNVMKIWNTLRTFFGAVMPVIMDIITFAFKVVMDVVMSVVSFLTAWIVGDWDTMRKELGKILKTIWNAIVTIFETLWGAVEPAVIRFIGDVENWFEKLPGKMLEVGKDMVRQLGRGISAMKDWLIGKGKDVLSGFTNLLSGSEPKDITSPLYGLGKRGKATAKMFTKGITKGMMTELPDIKASLSNVSSALSPRLQADGGNIDRGNISITNNNMLYEDQVTRAVQRALRDYSINFGVQ